MAKEKKIKIKQPPILVHQTQKLIQTIERRLGGRLITYWNNPRGAVCHNDVVAVFELLKGLEKQEKLFLFIKSDGGNGQASLRMVNLIRRYCDYLGVLVPLECASAATMIALGANEIWMGPMAYLTAVDTSLTHDLSPIDRDNDRVSVSLDELHRVVRLWQKEKGEKETNPYHALFPHVHPLVIGAVDRADSLSIMLCKELLSYHIKSPARAEKIATTLNSKYPSHNFPILLEEARRIGLKASPMPHDINGLLLQLNELYSEMGQKATTDFTEIRSHGNEIVNILEMRNRQVCYQQDKDWFYRVEERRWITMNDHSRWVKMDKAGVGWKKTVLHTA
jgi:hypothetical protein